jgi:hypothetical protein
MSRGAIDYMDGFPLARVFRREPTRHGFVDQNPLVAPGGIWLTSRA